MPTERFVQEFSQEIYDSKLWEWVLGRGRNVHQQVDVQTNLGIFIFIQWNAIQQ